MDPQWAGPALAEAWCYAKVSLSNGNLDRPSATAIITAIEGFVKQRGIVLVRGPLMALSGGR
jgi:hypothetical protein